MACFARPDAPNPPIRSEDWAPGETVTLRPRFTWGMESEAQQRGFTLPEGTDLQGLSQAQAAQLVQQHMDAKAVQQATFEAMILGWTLAFDDGEPAPLTPEMIAQLPKHYADFIAQEIQRRGGALPSAQQAGPEGDPTRPRSDSPSGGHSSTGSAPSSNARSQRHALSASSTGR